MDKLVLVGKAFADRNRVRIMRALLEQELCVCELCDALNLTQSTLSTHLQVIREAGLVTSRKDGKWSYYAVDKQKMPLLEALFGGVEERLATDPTVKADLKRLQRRLAQRENGVCCRGFAANANCCG